MKEKKRLDIILVERGFFESRQKAQGEILAGNVFVNDKKVEKPGYKFEEDIKIEIKARSPYVSRGAYKLLYAIDHYKIEVKDKVCMDIGASTGGFTQVLLEKGASFVYAIDCGTNQLDYRLRVDSRVKVMENTNARYLEKSSFDKEIDIAVMDVSFISITKIIPVIINIIKEDGIIISLIKPQFELEKEYISDKGYVKSENSYKAVEKIINFLKESNLYHEKSIESPIKGLKSGNVEYLILIRKKPSL